MIAGGAETSTSGPVETETIRGATCRSSSDRLCRLGCSLSEPEIDQSIHEAEPSSHIGTRDNANVGAIRGEQTRRKEPRQIHDPRSEHRDIADTIPAWAKESRDPAQQSP